MNDKNKKEFFDKFCQHYPSGYEFKIQGGVVVYDVLRWIESKKEEWELLAFHDGYQTRCDEDEIINRHVRSDKALKAIKHKAEKYQKIIKLGLKL